MLQTSILLLALASRPVAVGSPRFERGRHTAPVRAIARDPVTGDWISVGGDKTVRRWHEGHAVAPPLRFATGEGVNGRFYACAVSRTGLIAVGDGSAQGASVWLFDPAASAPVRRLALAGVREVPCLAFSADGKLLAAGDREGGLHVWSVSGDPFPAERSFGRKEGAVFAVAFAPSGTRLAYAAVAADSSQGRVGVVEADKGLKEVAHVVTPHPVQCLAWTGGASLALGESEDGLATWRLDAGETRKVETGRSEPGFGALAVAADAKGETLALGTNTGEVLLYGRRDGAPRRVRLAEDGSEVWAVGLTPDGRTLVAGLGNGEVCEVDVALGARTRVFSPASPRVTTLRWSADGSALRWQADGQSIGFDLVKSAPSLQVSDADADGHERGDARTGVKNDRAFVEGDARWAKLDEPRAYDALFLDERRLLVATPGGLKVYDGPDALPRIVPTDSAIASSLARSPDGRWVAVGFSDGLVRIYPVALEEPTAIASLYLDGGEWVAWQEETGRYDSSVGGDSLFGYQVNRGDDQLASFVPARLEAGDYRTPGLLPKLLGNAAPPAPAVPIRQAIADVPDVSPIEVKDGQLTDGAWWVEGDAAEVRLRVTGGKPGQRIALHLGHSRDLSLPPVLPIDRDELTLRIEGLVPGPNAVQATLNGQPLGRPFTIVRRRTAADPPARLVVLSIGIGKYGNDRLDLVEPVSDARGFVKTVEEFSIAATQPVENLLLDERATRQGILDALAWLKATATANDRVMVFIASHGFQQPDGVYVTPHDFSPAQPRETGLPWSLLAERLSDVSCRSLVLFSDNCHAGAALPAFRSTQQAREAARLEQRALSADMAVFAACGTDQESNEYESIGHGLFTAALIEGMRHEIPGQGYDPLTGIVTVDALKEAVQRGMDTIYRTQVSEASGGPNPQKVRVMVPDGAAIPVSCVKPDPAPPKSQGGRS